MKKYLLFALILFVAWFDSYSQPINRKAIYDSLTTLNPEIKQYFPRWKICERDLQIQIYQTFLTLGYDKEQLDMQNVDVLASPRAADYLPFEILLLTCGKSSMNSVEIESNMTSLLIGFISGELYYSGRDRGYQKDNAYRDYCYNDLPIDLPFSDDQTAAITNYLLPTNVTHAFTVSLFEQSLKFGETGFWIRSKIGTDQIGYHFWSSGESKIILQRPLYVNNDTESRSRIPFLINAYFGGAYRISGGINEQNNMLSWVKSRKLNTGPGGKLIAGLDFHIPILPEAGISLNTEIPLQVLNTKAIDDGAYSYYPNSNEVEINPENPNSVYPVEKIAALLRATGQITVFYNFWLDKSNPENFFRFDFGLNYSEVREMAHFRNTASAISYLTNDATNLNTYKPNEFGDWVFAKIEYRNQRTFPFGASIQYSNQILLGRVYIPLFGNWFYIEAKYAQPLRSVRPFESEHFFVVSPVLRLTI